MVQKIDAVHSSASTCAAKNRADMVALSTARNGVNGPGSGVVQLCTSVIR